MAWLSLIFESTTPRSQSGEKAVQLANPLNQTFLKQIPDQEIVPTGWFLPAKFHPGNPGDIPLGYRPLVSS